MRYIIETVEEEQAIGIQLAAWEKAGKLRLLEKGEPLEVLKEQQHRIQRALELLNKAGSDREVIIAFIQAKLPSTVNKSRRTIETVLYCQEQFYKALGITWGK